MRILIADDDLLSRKMLNGLLTKLGHTVQVVDNGGEAWKILDTDDPPHVAILDWTMPSLPGVEVCKLLRSREKRSNTYVYVILLTARDAKEDVMTGLEAGADDYVLKPFDAHELRVRLNAGRRIHQLQTDLMAAQRKLEAQAKTDSLTGVLNHCAITAALATELIRADREGGHVSLGMFDVDHFKAINDSKGHQSGDLVLCGCVERIQQCIRPYDALGRYGGEEFLLIVNGPIDVDASNVFERAVNAIREAPFSAFGNDIQVTISAGVAISSELSTAESLVRQADEALYEAKHAGRDRVVYAAAAAEITLVH